MYKAIHHDGYKSLVDVSEYLARHDIVYRRPALKPYEGLPVGDGKMGGLLYHEPNGIAMQVNHTDAIDFAPDGNMQAWSWETEERNTAPVACAVISIQSSLPCFDWVYLQDYEERLCLADGCVHGRAVSPFARLQWKVFAPADSGLMVFQIDAWQTEEAAWSIKADRWPSPNFFHHYEQITPLYNKNIDCISAQLTEKDIVLSQDLGRCRTATVCRVLNSSFTSELLHAHGGIFRLPKQREQHFTLLVSTCVHEKTDADPVTAACVMLNTHLNEKELFTQHQEYWRNFWARSFLHVAQEDYLENLWYVYLYQLNSCGRGKYPITFAGLWNWFKDSRNWGHFYHWNHQQNYWPVLAAGHPELYKNYLEYRWAMLEHARQDAKTHFDADGAFFSDISNLNGYNAIEPDTIRNCSVGAQIALDFYRYYLYTGDTAFLKNRAMPMMQACADFYRSILKTETDGTLEITGGATAYESYWPLKNTLTDLYVLKALLRAIEELGPQADIPEEDLAAYKALSQSLYDAKTERLEHGGCELEIFSAGEKWDGSPVRYGEGQYPWSPFPASLMNPVWPSEYIGLSDAGTKEFEIMRNTARVLLDRDVYQLGKLGCSGHAPAPEMAARLGMVQDMPKILHRFASAYQIFPNGLMHFSDVSQNQQWSMIDRPRVLSPNVMATQWEQLHEKTIGDRTEIPSEWFLHCYFEAAANLAAGLNEMLLQSHRGLLRVFPAMPHNLDAMFTLWAEGGFTVTSEMLHGEIRYVAIHSERGEVCCLADPWPGETAALRIGHSYCEFERVADSIRFETVPAGDYILFRSEFPPECYYHSFFDTKKNTGVKKLEGVQLGLSKYY